VGSPCPSLHLQPRRCTRYLKLHKYNNINKIRDDIDSGTLAKTETEIDSKVVDVLKKFRTKKDMIVEQLRMYTMVIIAGSYVIKPDFNYLVGRAKQLGVLGTRGKKWSMPE